MFKLFFIFAIVMSAVAAFSPATFKRGSFALSANCKTPDSKGRCPGDAGYYSQPVTDAPTSFADYQKAQADKKSGGAASTANCKNPDSKGRCPGEAGYYSQPVTDAPSSFADYQKAQAAKKAAGN